MDTDLSPDGVSVKKESPKGLISHGTTPSGKPRLYVCSICTRAFARMEHLHRHERSHTKEKPFTCGVCQRKFSRRDLLLRHAQKLHAGCSDAITRLRRKLLKNDQINFNVNFFQTKENPQFISSAPQKLLRSASMKDPNLHREIFDRHIRNRGVSFSAQSGPNYATAIVDFQHSYPADNVEFSTPQLMPSTTIDENRWLSNLSIIPGMSINGKFNIEPEPMNNEVPPPPMASEHRPDYFRSKSLPSTNSVDSAQASAPNITQIDSLGKLPVSSEVTPKTYDENYGYTLYDIPELMMSEKTTTAFGSRINRPLLPIKQEMDDELMELEKNSDMKDSLCSAINTEGVNFDINFLNDIDELTQDLDMSSQFQPSGYSFYGDNPLAASSEIESTSPPPFMSPSYSSTVLFTKNMRLTIIKALSKYPISGIMSPIIPTNEKLEFYLKNFTDKFLSHFPFVHTSKLNEQEIMAMTANEDPKNESAQACMPLLVATIGALLANEKNDSEHLYEASRRTIHIYLESRRNLVSNPNAPQQHSVNPLWLIQSLSLSVIYGLFSDNENNVYIVIRQLNALNSLVKTSVKNERNYFFLVPGSDTEPVGAQSNNLTPESKFKNAINEQSQLRIVLIIYNLTNFILMMYNVPLTLSLNDLGSITCPNIYDEFLWRFYDYDALASYLHSIDSPNDLDFYLHKDESNTIVFKELLMKLISSDFSPPVVTKLSNLSKYGFTLIVQGMFEIKQYDELKNLDVWLVLDNMSLFLDSSKTNLSTRFPLSFQIDFEKLDCAIIISCVKICSIIDFRSVKEQSWLRNYEELTRNYFKFLMNVDLLSDFDLVKVIDCCILITKLVLFRTDDAAMDSSNGKEEIFLSELAVLGASKYSSPFKTMVHESLLHQYNTCVDFEKAVHWKVFDELDSSKNLMNSQILFHSFMILSIFAVHIAKRNNPGTELGRRSNPNNTKQMNNRFILVLGLMAKIENFLREKYQALRREGGLTNMYMFLCENEEFLGKESFSVQHEADVIGLFDSNSFACKMDKSLYILKVGELMMKYLYDTNIKICIFKKLSDSLSQIRKFLIDSESMILQ
ncbi:hypothetical protein METBISCDRAFT_13118 [Metschnikowia bicuspidata]|uniref:C2H2-type domain-containing protein n=1 Tax=Metschnikowia bicuspidata TaxID=27322 RepID=A0A4P9ZG69_9ASCO|nr:hypothetical protein METBISCDRAFT_13118 [Metschnikowia bicuspidata]